MRVLALNGSPHAEGNSAHLLEAFLAGAKENGAESIRLDLNAMNIKPCQGCEACKKDMTTFCVQKDDMGKLYYELGKADVLLIATPVYFWEISAQVKLFIDRLFGIFGTNFDKKLVFPKKVVVLYNYGAGTGDHLKPYFNYLKTMFDFIDTEDVRMLGFSSGVEKIANQPDVLKSVQELGSELTK